MQTALVVLIVIVAAVYVARVFFKGFKQKQNCACGCSGCGIADECDESPGGHHREIPTDRSNSQQR